MQTKEAVKHFGSQTAVGKALGITKGAVSNWKGTVPLLRAYQLQEISEGKLKAPKFWDGDESS